MVNNFGNYQKTLLDLKSTAQNYIDYLPSESLRVSTSNGSPQYYRVNRSVHGNGQYIPSSELEIAKNLANRDYCQKLTKEINIRLHIVNLLQKNPDALSLGSLDNVFASLHPLKQRITTPLFESNEQYIKNWYTEHSFFTNTIPINTNIFTNRNEEVRSKTEKIIADKLDALGIPYVYECSYKCNNSQFLSPDFTILNIRTRRTWLWEHFGCMSDTQYTEKTCKKISNYQKNSLFLGDGLIATFESSSFCPDTREFDALIHKYLL